MAETEHLDFHDSWICGSHGNPFYGFEYSGLLYKIKEIQEQFVENIISLKHLQLEN